MKIALIASSSYPIHEKSTTYGARFIFSLVRFLGAHNHEVVLFASPGSKAPCTVHTFNFNSIDWRYESEQEQFYKRFVEDQHAYLEVFTILKQLQVDVIHNFSVNQVPLFTATFLATPTITTLFEAPSALQQSGVKLSQSSKNLYLAASYYLKSLWTPHTKIDEIIYTGIDLNRWSYSAAAEDQRAFWNGNIERGSNLEKVIKACEAVGFKLWFTGEVVEDSYFEYVIKPLLNSEIQYLGDLSTDDRFWYQQKAAVTVVTKIEKDYNGQEILKSLAGGTPVVGMAVENCAEFLPVSCGVICKDATLGALEKALVNSSFKKRLDCRNYVENNFDCSKALENYRALYVKVGNAAVPKPRFKV